VNRKFKRVLRVRQKPTLGQAAPPRPTQVAQDGRFASAAPERGSGPDAPPGDWLGPAGGRRSEKQIAELAVRRLTADARGDPAPGRRSEAKFRGESEHIGRGLRSDPDQRI
jgi:hypothetical protein